MGKSRPLKMPDFWPDFSGRHPEEWEFLSRKDKKLDIQTIHQLITMEDESGVRKPKGRIKLPLSWVEEDPIANNKFTWWQKTTFEQEEIRKRLDDSNKKKRGRPKGMKDS